MFREIDRNLDKLIDISRKRKILEKYIDIQTNKQIDIWTNRQIFRQIDRYLDKYMDIQTNRWIFRQIDGYLDKQIDIQTNKYIFMQRIRQIFKQIKIKLDKCMYCWKQMANQINIVRQIYVYCMYRYIYIQYICIIMPTGISHKENFQMCLSLSFHNYKISSPLQT